MTYYAREYTDPAGGALTITTDHQGLWITATEGREEVTVGPFPATTLADDMDGGVTAALIEQEQAGSYTRTDEDSTPACVAETVADGEVWYCTRGLSHDGPHVAATLSLGNSIGAVWDEQPRPLTADDNAAQERAMDKAEALGIPLDRLGARAILHAALTVPPNRPEGAEELARLIADADVGEWDCGDLADALLATGRVRLATEEES